MIFQFLCQKWLSKQYMAITWHPLFSILLPDMFARWYCVRYPDSDRDEYRAKPYGPVAPKKNERKQFNRIHTQLSVAEEKAHEDNLKQAQEDRKNEKYADSQPHMMDDPFQWFHLVLIANPVPMGVKKDDTGNGRTVLWRWWCVGVLFVLDLWLG